ncbi:CehA/McbA family metallohydrolase, partial [Myxococcota bacterium]
LGDLLTLCTEPEPGCDPDDPPTHPALIAGYAPGLVSYGYFVPNEPPRIELSVDELWLVMSDSLSLEPGESGTFTRYLAVGAGEPAALLPEVRRRSGLEGEQSLGGQVTFTSGGPAAEAVVDVLTLEGDWVTRAVADADGGFRAVVGPGEYQLVARFPATDPSSPLAVDVTSADASDLVLTVDEPARLLLDIRDEHGDPVPARVDLLPGTDPNLGAHAALTIFSVDGSGEAWVVPGDYVAAVTRGYEYDHDWVPVVAVSGEATTLSAVIAHVVDTAGYVSVDSHSHTYHSIDSQLAMVDRVAQAAAEHVEVVVTTEHDNISDLAPAITAQDAWEHLTTGKGIEISPVYGHMNAYPVTFDNAPRKGYWPIAWWGINADGEVEGQRPPVEVFADARDLLGAQVVQLNHPREGQGILNEAGYDPAVGFAGVDPLVMDTNFDAVEVPNSNWDSDDEETLVDWFSFLSQGIPITAVGVSDSHGLGRMLGCARTLVAVPDDVVGADFDVQTVWDAMLAQRATVVVGPFVELWAVDDQSQEIGIGELATRQTGLVQLRVRVQAAPFVETARLRIYANGQEVLLLALPDPGDPPDPLRFDEVVDIDWTGPDAWFVAMVEGDQPMHPLNGDRPRSLTNPVYVDRDGDGSWTPPGL